MNNKIFIAQLVGLFVIMLAMFGVDVTDEQQAQIISGLSAFGLVLTAVIDRWEKWRAEKSKQNTLE